MYGSIIASTFLLALVRALPTPEAASAAISDTYTYYTGDGSAADGWPAEASWGSFSDLWNANVAVMEQSCGWNGWGADDSSTEANDIQTAIVQLAGSSGIDERFILAIIMQESEGCVRVPTTGNGVVNPGLMQSHDGSGTCVGVNPCPQSEITQMVTDGVSGTSSGDGLTQVLSQAESHLGVTTSQAFYAAARIYNSGSADYANLDDGITSTACYASDVANRLTGWTLAASSCTA